MQAPNRAPIIEAQSFTASEALASGAIIDRVHASDPDANALRFTISANSPRTGTGLFAIDPQTGDLRLAPMQSLDFENEAERMHSITVQVSDGSLSASATVSISVTDTNEPPTLNQTTLSIAENSASGTVIGTLSASDPEGQSVTLSLQTNSPATGTGLFAFDSTTSVLSLAPAQTLDFESAESHSLTIGLSDGVNTTTAPLNISITNILEVNFSGATQPATANENTRISLSASGVMADISPATYRWELASTVSDFDGLEILSPNSAQTDVNLPYLSAPNSTANLQFRLTISAGGQSIRETLAAIPVSSSASVDSNSDGLIEIRSLTMLHNIRYNLAGTSYDDEEADTGAGDTGSTMGCPASGCFGYELVRNLNFDRDGDGSTWTGSAPPYNLDSDDSNADYFDTANGGWLPIGTSTNRFTAVFNGNGRSIRNLAINRPTLSSAGLFGATSAPGHIANTHLVNALVSGSSGVGALVGTTDSSVAASSASGIVQGNAGSIGGLLGFIMENISVTAVYSNASVRNTSVNDSTGGLLGRIGDNAARISASYATGAVTSMGNSVGSLIGYASTLSTTPPTRITASYATGNAEGANWVGNLIGRIFAGPTRVSITQSFGFGTIIATGTTNTHGTPLPAGVTVPNDLILALANGGASASADTRVWNSAEHNTAGAWDFDQRAANGGPSLMYADYDGPTTATGGSRFYCEGETEPSFTAGTDPRPIRIANCGEHLPHQFAREN